MPVIPRAARSADDDPMLTLLYRAVLNERDHGAHVKPSSMGAGVLVVFCLIGASLALMAWWLFIRRSGFIWRHYDWQEYKSSVLRRPEERPDDAITVFSDGTARRGGPRGSSVGARTVVLGELDTTYTKSYIAREKPWGPREMKPVEKKHGGGLLGSVWGKVEGSMWGRLRGGEHDENDTVVMREKSMRRSRTERRVERGKSQRRSKRQSRRRRAEASGDAAAVPFVDTQEPAPPLTDITRSSDATTNISRPARMPTRAGKAAVSREPSYAVGDDRGPVRISTKAGKAPVKKEPSYSIGDDRGGPVRMSSKAGKAPAKREPSYSIGDDRGSSVRMSSKAGKARANRESSYSIGDDHGGPVRMSTKAGKAPVAREPSYTAGDNRRPVRMSTKAGKAPITREPSYAPGDDSTARYHRHHRTQSAVTGDSSSSDETISSSESETDSEDESSSEEESELDQSQLGMAKGNKVYHHPISQDRVFWGNARPLERGGDGAGGTYGGGAPALMPRGYRAGSVGSLSSADSVKSSNVGR